MSRAEYIVEFWLLDGSVKFAEPDIHFSVEELVKMDTEFLALLMRCLED